MSMAASILRVRSDSRRDDFNMEAASTCVRRTVSATDFTVPATVVASPAALFAALAMVPVTVVCSLTAVATETALWAMLSMMRPVLAISRNGVTCRFLDYSNLLADVLCRRGGLRGK